MSDHERNAATVAAVGAFIAKDILDIKVREQVTITCDDATDMDTAWVMYRAVVGCGAQPTILTVPRLPFQGKLADPYIPETLSPTLKASDVWLDLTFPYLSGSSMHADVMRHGRTRMLALHGLDTSALVRLFSPEHYDALYELQKAVDSIVAARAGIKCRVTTPLGTDVSFVTTKPSPGKPRIINEPGTYTPIGSAVIYPDPSSVRGQVVLEGGFHEYMSVFRNQITIEVDSSIRQILGVGTDMPAMQRALRRASGGDGYGQIIHFSYAFHPYARLGGTSFLESVRAYGCNAIGFGIPWWEDGGGENHPDGLITAQSIWLDDKPFVVDGALVDEGIAKLQDAV